MINFFVTYIFGMCVSRRRIWVPSEVCAAPRNKIVGILVFISKNVKNHKTTTIWIPTTLFLVPHSPLKVLKFLVLKHTFQICKLYYCRPNRSVDIGRSVFNRLRQDFWRVKTLRPSCTHFCTYFVLNNPWYADLEWHKSFENSYT